MSASANILGATTGSKGLVRKTGEKIVADVRRDEPMCALSEEVSSARADALLRLGSRCRVRDEEAGGMEAAAGLDDGPCMPGLGSVALGGAGGRRWSWWHHPACRRRALGFLADDLVSAERYQQIVATTEPRAGHTQWVSVSAPGIVVS